MNGRALALAMAVVAAPLGAYADGMPPPAAPAVAAPCCEVAPIWTGVYIGTHLGGAWSDPSWTFPFAETFNTAAGQSFSSSASGAVWGGHIGANYQFNRFLIGVEVSYAGSRLTNSVIGPLPSNSNRFGIDVSDLFTVSGRLGIVHGQYLFYAKTGYASSQLELNAGPSGGVLARSAQREGGWLVGAGLESRMVSNIIFGLEYNYVGLASDRFTGLTTGTIAGAPFNADIDNAHMHTVLARLSILFGPHACCGEGLLGKY